MTTSDKFSVTAAYDKAAYNNGDTITVTITGNDVQTSVTQGTAGPLTVHLTAADGATQDIALAAQPVTITTTTPESVVITGITDTSSTPRTWTVAASGVTATATA
jgi:hypothetical protein